MFRSFVLVSAALAAGAAAAPAAAQSPDQMADSIGRLARKSLGHAQPIVPAALDRQTVKRGALTAQIQACGGRWESASYLPYMAQLRASGRYSKKQLAYVGVVHGIAQQMVLNSLASRPEPCPARARAAVTAAIGR